VNAEVRFIEYMDVGGANRWAPGRVFAKADMIAALTRAFGPIEAVSEPGSSAPAERYRLSDGTTFGVIASTTEPFCAACDRSRLTADGFWLLCLYARGGLDLRRPLREGATPGDIVRLLQTVWSLRADRGAEERRGAVERRAFVPLAALKRDAHHEMHTRGG
jgi:cyclic pyranopterin phosphate synthase